MKYWDEEERKLIESIETEGWAEVPDMRSAIEEAEQIARKTTAKNERMNIRMNEGDLKALKARAVEEGLPYQTLVSSVLHKYVTGRLVKRE
jgi:predicted DNA binding CopG/RHH family protein